MLSRDDFKFILPPWEHRGADFDPRPDQVVELDFEGTAHQFLLKAKRNLLFFREAHQSNDYLCALEPPLFSRSPPEEELREWMQTNAAFVESFWQEEVKVGRYARCITGEHPHSIGTFLMFFKQDGHGWLREPWDEAGLEFTWESEMIFETPLFNWVTAAFPASFAVFSSNRQLLQQIGEREMPEDVVKEHPLQWICGSQQQLEQLTRWMAFTEPEEWRPETQKTFVLSCENDEGPAELCSIIEDGRWSEPSPRLKALTNLALDFNTPIGIRWEFCDGSWGNPPLRRSWEPEGPEVRFSIEQPSSHEHLEAHQELRDWLRDKIPNADITKWLSLTPNTRQWRD